MSLISQPEIRFFEFSGQPWKAVALNKYILSHKGGASLKPHEFIEKSKFEVIPKKAITAFGQLSLDSIEPTYCTQESFKNYANSVIDKNYLITTLRDLVPSGPTIGYIVEFKTNNNYLLAQGVYGFKINESTLSRGFLIQFSNTIKYRRLIRKMMVGSTQVHIRNKDFFSIGLNVPSFKEQQKVADFLSSVDKKISQLKEKHTLLQQYKKGVMQQLFTQQVRFKDDKGKAFVDWKEKPLSSLLTLTLREIDKPEANYMAIGVRSHMKGTFQKLDFDPETIAMEKMYVVRHNDLIVNITFAWEGAIAIVKKEDDGGLVSHRFPTYTFKKGQAIHEYFRHIISFKRFKYMLDVISPGGAGRNRVLSKKDFLALRWNMPCVEEQKKIATFLDTLDTKINLVAQQIEQTQQFKKGLLQQMFV